jgi:ABC-type lipoprotein release transport system permease subunit
MITLLASAWRIVVNRTLADWLILSAALITVLIATTLLASGPIYADAVALSGVHRTLADSPVTDVNLQVTVRTNEARFEAHNRLVQREVVNAVSATGGQMFRRGVSESYALPFQEEEDRVRNLAVFSFFDAFEERVTLVDGDWPATTSEPFEVMLSSSTAQLLNVGVGDEFRLTNRRDEEYQPLVRVSGLFEIIDASDPYWMENTLDLEGVNITDSFSTFGPFVVTQDVFFTSLTPQSGEVRWNILPEFSNLEVNEIVSLRQRVEALGPRLNQETAAGNQFFVNTELNTILRQAERSLLVTRSGVLVLTIQLAILAGYALLLTAGLLADQRNVETSLIRSRGASNRQIATMAMMEGLLLALPAVLLGPPVAALSLRILNSYGPLAGIGLTIEPVITSTAYLLALVTGLACVVALTLPALISARSFSKARAERGRQESHAFSQRAGLDLVLLALAALAYWQLRRYSAPITQTVEGRLGIDPLLVSAPAIGLLAGAVIAMRTIPLLARLSEAIVRGGTKIVPALGAWQVARRPMRYARSALLLILALGIGLFAVSYSETWKLSQADQADYQVGADVRVTPHQRVGRSIPRYALPDAYSQIDGISASLPVSREVGQISRSAGSGHAILLDTVNAADVVEFRPDLSDEPFDVLMYRLADRRPELATLPLPGQPEEIAIDVMMEIEPVDPDAEIPAGWELDDRRLNISPIIAMILQDANGSLFRIEFGTIPESAEPTRLTAPVIYQLQNGAAARPAYPLSIVDFEVRIIAPRAVYRSATIDITGLHTSEAAGGTDWTSVVLPGNAADWQYSGQAVMTILEAPEILLTPSISEEGLAFLIRSGTASGNQVAQVIYYLRPAGTDLPDTIPVLVSENFLAITSSDLGDTSEVQIGDLRGTIEIVGVVRGFPTLNQESNGLFIADLPTVAMHRFEPGRPLLSPDELWIEVDDARVDDVVTILGQDPFLSRSVDSREQRARTLLSDPVALGAIGSLSLGFVAAIIFAGVGFVVSAIVSARERMTEFALLRALGLSPRQLLRWMTLENGILLLIALIGGTLLGLALSWLILPLISVTQRATRVFPEVDVVIPWTTIILLELGVIAVLGLIVGLLALILRRVGLGSMLRLGEDT